MKPFSLLSFFFMTISLGWFALGQADNQPNEPVVLPLTEAEKTIVSKEIVSNQPDFTATEAYFSARAISGFSVARNVARKGRQYRVDTGMVVIISELDRPVIRVNQDKTFETGVANFRPFVSATVPLNPTDLLGFEDISFTSVGTIELERNKLLKIQAKSKEFEHEIFLYADLGRKNLITIIQILGSERRSIQRLQDISFEVPDKLFDLTGYRERPKLAWRKVDGAKVTSKGKVVEEARVYRHKDYLFVHAGEFDHMLIDLKKEVALTTVYRGLLLSKTGAYIWTTNDDEAISIGELSGYIKEDSDWFVRIRYSNNVIKIPERKNKGQILLEISW